MVFFHDNNSAEVRHAAVIGTYGKKEIGKKLWEKVLDYIIIRNKERIFYYARNTSINYWMKLGFIEDSDWLDHEQFKRHGIRFKRLVFGY